MDTSIVGVGVGITDRFRSVVEEKAARIEHLCPRAQLLDVKVTHRSYRNGRAEEKRVDNRNHPRGAKFEKGSGSLEGIDVQPASVDVIRAVATGSVPIVSESDEDDYSPVVIREKQFDAEWMTVEDAVDRMELVGHDFFLFIDARTDHPSVVYRRKGWDYGVISLTTAAQPEAAVAS